MISHRYRCIYVKVPKRASTAVRDWFLAHGGGRHSFSPSWYPGPMAHRIQSVGRVLELHPDYFTFSFVRNPYRRFVSIYRHASRLAEARRLFAPLARLRRRLARSEPGLHTGGQAPPPRLPESRP